MMMKAMGGKMAKGYAKGGAKMIRAQKGKEIKRPKIMISDVRNMKMTQRQKQLVGAGGASKLASMINKLPKSGKLALAGGLTAGTIALISKLNPGASRAGKQLREMKKKKIQEMKKKKYLAIYLISLMMRYGILNCKHTLLQSVDTKRVYS